MTELYLIRHAQASFGSDHYDQLSPLGYRQSNLLGEFFRSRDLYFDHVFTGSLNRQKQTLEAIRQTCPDQSDVSSIELPGLDEYHFIELNRAYAKLYSEDDLVIKVAQSKASKRDYFRLLRRVLLSWSKNELEDIAESFSSFKNRVDKARKAIQKRSNGSNRVLAISSGGAISQFIGSILQTPDAQSIELNLQIRNSSISRLNFNDSIFRLSSFNATPHLEATSAIELITYG